MKKLYLILLLALTLSACSEQIPHSTSNSSESSSINQNSDEQLTTSEDNSLPTLDNSANTPFYNNLDENALNDLDEFIQSLDINDFIAKSDVSLLKNIGIDVDISDIKKIDNFSFSFSLNMQDGNANSTSHKLIATLSYNNHGDDGEIELVNFDFYWGSFTYEEDKLVISANDKIYVYDNPMQTLTFTEIKPNITSDLEPYYLLFAMPYNDNYLAMMYEFGQTAHIVFDADGNVLSTEPFDRDYFFVHDIESSASNVDCTAFMIPKKISEGQYYTRRAYDNDSENIDEQISAPMGGIIYNINNNTITDVSLNLRYIIENGKEFYLFENYTYDIFTAIIYKNNKIIAWHQLETELLHYNFPYSPYYNEILPLINFENNLLTMSNPESKCTLELDFNNLSENITFDFTYEDLQKDDWVIYSPDWRYSLHNAYSYGGGDVSLYYKAVYDTQTGEITVIDIVGGMYGGNAKIGFLPNNDIYSTDLFKYKIYSEENGFAETFTLEDSFNLANDSSDETPRYLFSVWQNPSTFEFVVLYADVPLEELATDEFTIDTTYKIALLSAGGELIESYDTKQNIYFSYFGFYRTNIEYYKDNLIIYYYWPQSGEEFLLGVFDLNAKTYYGNH